MRTAIFSVVALIPFVAILAQNTPAPAKYEISGTVIEPGVNHPVVDAEVTIFTEIREIGKRIERIEVGKVRTDAQGAFRFSPDKPERYVVVMTPKEGYIRGGFGIESFQSAVTLTEKEPSAKLSFSQARAAEVIGTIVDYETGAPLSGVRITAQNVPGARGGAQFFGGSDRVEGPVSDAQGHFTIAGLGPGRFYLQIPPVRAYSTRVTDKFTEEDTNEVELDFDGYDFVQGVDMTGVIPVTTISGGTTNAGTVRARKIKYYRARVTVDGADCSLSDPVQVSHYTMNGNSMRLFGPYNMGCGKPLLVRMLRPGESFLEVSQGKGVTRRRTTASLFVADKNLNVPIVLGRGIDVDVLITMADGASREALDQGMSKVTFSMSVVGGVNFADYMPTRAPGADGRMEALNQRPGSSDIYLGGLPTGHYIQEIRYNGSPINGNIVTWNSGASAENLVVVIDNRPAAISGTVQSSGKGLAKAQALLVKWPPQEDVFRSVTRATANGTGSFQFTTLASGSYRIFAVTPEQAPLIDLEPGVLVRALTRAQSLTLERSSSPVLTLEPQDISR